MGSGSTNKSDKTHTPPVVEYNTGVPGFRFLRGSNVTFSKPRTIVHADYTIKLTTRGLGAPIRYKGARHKPCSTGQLSVFSPFEPLIAGKSAYSTSFASLVIEPHLLHSACEALDRSSLSFHSPHILHTALARQLAVLNADMDTELPTADLELQFSEALELLLEIPGSEEKHPAPKFVLHTRELVLDNLDKNLSAETLERELGLSRFHLIRLFRKHYGLPPGEFRTYARLSLARKLLAGGSSQAEAAQAAGFFDQSHFHRHFRRVMNISPGAFQKVLRLRAG
ncbi:MULTISPECIES: AraC family transcriptional regulator [unclassified Microbulbifer]|uniref:helix-turn-helix domain-containing protein n=1 Tax=unclassified Microbulbifer TaxID=2619833 RepID=UPI0027E581CB|nr:MULTISPECIES: AraC family transcriptional regulator [unclassified Microbulbifer]